MMEVKNLCVSLQGKEILHSLSFSLQKGKIIMMLGENGSGKTTLIKTLLQMIPFQTGRICYQGQDIRQMNQKQRAQTFSYVPQVKEVVSDLRVEECIVSGCTRQLSLFATPNKQAYERVDDIMQLFHLEGLKGKRLHEISGGELQLTYLARAFLQDSAIMLMDEPCTYLDFRKQHLFLQETKKLKEANKSTLISIHDPNLAMQYGDEILLMHEGNLYAHLKKDEVDLKKTCCQLYNELYGNHFVYENEVLIWKEK